MNKTLKNLNILLVEDEKKLAKLLKSAIGDNFATFNIAYDGQDGIQQFIQLSPDLVITDIMMPNMTGLEMAQKLKDINPEIPIIVLSAFSEKEKLLGAIDVGIIKYFIKPFDPDELLEYIITISDKLNNKFIILQDDFKFDKEINKLLKDDKYIIFTKRENLFLKLLVENSPDMVTNELINKTLWDGTSLSDERLRTFIKRFRIKTSKNLIHTIRGQGYQLILG